MDDGRPARDDEFVEVAERRLVTRTHKPSELSQKVLRATLYEDPSALPPDVVMQGWMEKQGEFGTGWRKRFCILRPPYLSYYKRELDLSKVQGVIDVSKHKVRPHTELSKAEEGVFTLSLGGKHFGRVFEFRLSDDAERLQWLEQLHLHGYEGQKQLQASVFQPLPPAPDAGTNIDGVQEKVAELAFGDGVPLNKSVPQRSFLKQRSSKDSPAPSPRTSFGSAGGVTVDRAVPQRSFLQQRSSKDSPAPSPPCERGPPPVAPPSAAPPPPMIHVESGNTYGSIDDLSRAAGSFDAAPSDAPSHSPSRSRRSRVATYNPHSLVDGPIHRQRSISENPEKPG